MNLSYDLIDERTIKLASSIQATIFPGELAIEHYKNSIKTNYKNSSYYIIKYNNIPVGVTGIYNMSKYNKNIDDNSMWLGWFGILPEFRRKGIGRQALLDTVEKAKMYNKEYFRIYTVSTDNKLAQPLYKSIMHAREPYKNKEDYNYNNNCYIYSYNLKGNNNIELWNNKYAYINEDIEMEKKSNSELNNFYKILINISPNSKEFNQIITLATSFREDGHLVTINKKIKNTADYNIVINVEQFLSLIDKYNSITEIKEYYYNQLREANNG